MSIDLDFNQIHKYRDEFLKSHAEEDHTILFGTKGILLSAPHGVFHIREGRELPHELGSIQTALYLQKQQDCLLIAKTKNNNDDANFDPDCDYRKSITKLIKKHNIKYLIDFHGLSNRHGIDVNLGINNGNNISTNKEIFETLKSQLENSGFTVSVDIPYNGGNITVAGSTKNKFPDLWTIQIELNIDITHKIEHFNKYKVLLHILNDWLTNLQ
jgi:hypothetical protein